MHSVAMAPRVKTHQAVLQVLQSAKPTLRKAILKASDKELIYAICEICDNLLVGNIPITTPQKAQLKKFRRQIRSLAQKGGSLQQKRDALLQRGGAFLPLLLSVVASILPSLFKSS